MTKVIYQATGRLPAGVPAAVVARHGVVTILVDDGLTVAQVCEALTPLITAHAEDCWQPQEQIA